VPGEGVKEVEESVVVSGAARRESRNIRKRSVCPRFPQKISEKHSATLFAQGGGHMADIQRIDAQQAHTKVKSNQALLVCAYDDEAKCRKLNLDGSISLASFKSRVNSLPKSQEMIFY
jgi:hypothetical protein